MPRKRQKPWSKKVHTVTIMERVVGGPLYLRWWDPAAPGSRAGGGRGNYCWRSLGHRDREEAERAALKVAAQIAASADAAARGRLTVAALFARYEEEEVKPRPKVQRAEYERRMKVWQHFLGAEREVHTIDAATLTRFARARRAGRLKVPGVKLAADVADATVWADIVMLQTALNWATRVTLEDGSPLLDRNPVAGYRLRPEKGVGRLRARRKRPLATYDRWLRIYRMTDRVDPQKRFRTFWVLVGELGWRVSAICQLRRSHVDLRPTAYAPYGQIFMDPRVQKEAEEGWVPLSALAARALRLLFRRHPMVGDAWLFPSPRRRGKPWRRWHARDLLERAEAAAGLEKIEGGDFHPYRRRWETERKHLPIADVMRVQGRRDQRTLLESYQQADPETMLEVVESPRRLREKRASAIANAIAGGRGKRNDPAAEVVAGS